MKNAYDLLNKMAALPIQYGLWDKQNNRAMTGKELWEVNGTAEISDRCIVMHPDEVWKRKLGTCWDCTLLEWEELKKMGYRYIKGVYFEQQTQKGRFTRTTHSFIIYKENGSKLFNWFEYTWYNFCGLHGPYNTEEEIYTAVQRCALSEHNRDVISYWNKDLNIKKILEFPEISIMDFLSVAHPEIYGGS